MRRRASSVAARLLATGLVLAVGVIGCHVRRDRVQLFLLVTVDTLRADRLGAYGGTYDLTPNLDRLAAESTLFETMYAPSAFTVPSLSTILTGHYPETNGIFTNESLLPGRVLVLAEELSRRGARTGAVVSNYVLRSGTGLERGFELYNDQLHQRELNRKLPERVADATTTDALAMLDQLGAGRSELLFLWVHYQDPHGPYTPPEGYRERYLEREREQPEGDRALPHQKNHRGLGGIPDYQRIGDESEVAFYRAGYDAEVRYADEQIGRLLDGIRTRGLMGNAVIVFAADHGESLGENDYWFAHGEYLSDPLVRVPFFIRVPGRPPERRRDLAALVDVVPTVLPLVGAPVPPGLPGRNLLAAQAATQASTPYLATLRASTVPRFGVVRDGFKYLAAVRGGELEEELFRLGQESVNVASQEPERLLQMRREIGAIRARWVTPQRERRRELTEEDLARLRALGYVGRP